LVPRKIWQPRFKLCEAGLPDGFFSDQNSHNRYTLEDLGMKNVFFLITSVIVVRCLKQQYVVSFYYNLNFHFRMLIMYGREDPVDQQTSHEDKIFIATNTYMARKTLMKK
jgi:hypothetical protein